MVTLTDNAIGLIRRLLNQPGMAEEAGVRIAVSASPRSLSVRVTDRPYHGDHVVTTSGARLFLDAVAAQALAGKALDASIVDGRVTFAVTGRAAYSEEAVG